jgi:DNA-directed RNA polymerase subunit RPC12/RpoP
MENKKNMKKLRTVLLATGIPVGIVEWTTILFWIITGNWRPFAAYLVVFIPYAVWISRYYFQRVAYICPECHAVFKPSLKEAFFARHTPTLRKVTCTHCGHKGFCVETYGEAADK